MIPYIIAYTVVIYIYSDYAHQCNTSLEPQVRTTWMCTPVNGS